MTFSPDMLQRLRDAEEVRIETRRGTEGPIHRTIIWVVVDDHDRVLVRTYLGPGSRWYREALANPDCGLWLGREMLPVRAERAEDPDRVEAASLGFTTKYAGQPSMRAMVRTEVLPTTLELLPR